MMAKDEIKSNKTSDIKGWPHIFSWPLFFIRRSGAIPKLPKNGHQAPIFYCLQKTVLRLLKSENTPATRDKGCLKLWWSIRWPSWSWPFLFQTHNDPNPLRNIVRLSRKLRNSVILSRKLRNSVRLSKKLRNGVRLSRKLRNGVRLSRKLRNGVRLSKKPRNGVRLSCSSETMSDSTGSSGTVSDSPGSSGMV